MLNRRQFVLSSALALLDKHVSARCRPVGLQRQVTPSRHLIGGQATWAELKSEPNYAARFLREFGVITPGTELKWQTLSPSPDVYRFEYADQLVAWAQEHRLRIRGHNLVWPNYGTPDWVKARADRTNARALLEEHIRKVVRRYRGRIYCWDVVNEPLNVWDGRPDLLAAHPWAELLGPEYIDLAFHAAAEEDPGARLIWNQNYLESVDKGDQANREAMLVQLRRLKRNGVPIHGIGIESHLFAEKKMATVQMQRFLGEVRSLGLEIQITELDVIDTALPGDLASRDAAVAEVYARYLEMMLQYADPTVVVFWSFSDRHNWLDWAAKTNPKYRRLDGTSHRPGLVDQSLRNKVAYERVAEVFCRAGNREEGPHKSIKRVSG